MLAPVLALSATLFQAPLGRTDRTPVVFTCNCKSDLSKRFETKFRDLLARSPRYREVPFSIRTDDNKTSTHWTISTATTISSGLDSDPDSIAVSIVFLLDGLMMQHAVEVCGKSRLDECAENILSGFDHAASQ